MEAEMRTLKIGKLRDTTPVKLTITLMPELEADLQEYAQVYERTYGQKEKPADLVPLMLASFMASDGNFKKARKELK